MHRRRWLALALAGVAGAGQAQTPPALIISSNNTPLDLKALSLLSQEAFRRVGLSMQLVSNPSERSLFFANAGEVDGEGLRVAGLSAQYPNLVQVPEPYIRVSFVAFARDERIRLDHGWASLKAHRVAYITGWKLFDANVPGGTEVTRVDKAEQLLRMLDSGRIDLALYTLADGTALARSLDLRAHALMPALKELDMFLYLHKRHAGLAPRLAQALQDMKADGSHRRIVAAVQADS